MNFSLESAYYDNSFQKFNAKAPRRDNDALSDISFSDGEVNTKKARRGGKLPKSESKKTGYDSPFASLFEINPESMLKKKKETSQQNFSFTQPNQQKKIDSQSGNELNEQKKANFALSMAEDPFHSEKFNYKESTISFENRDSEGSGEKLYRKIFGRRNPPRIGNLLTINEKENETRENELEPLDRRDRTTETEEKPKIFDQSSLSPFKNGNSKNQETLAQTNISSLFSSKEHFIEKLTSGNLENKKTVSSRSQFFGLVSKSISTTPPKESENKDISLLSPSFKSPSTKDILKMANVQTLDKIIPIASSQAQTLKKRHVNHSQSSEKVPVSKHQELTQTTQQFSKTPKENGQKAKGYGEIFKQRIDQKKVSDLASQAKQNTVLSISQDAVPNKKYVASYMENFIKKNNLEPKPKPRDINFSKVPTEGFGKIDKSLFFEESKENKANTANNSAPKKRQRTKKTIFFAQEVEPNQEESVSDHESVNSDSSEEGVNTTNNPRKLNRVDIDFEQFFEEAMEHPFISQKGFKKKGKIAKKLEVKSQRVRVKKDKVVKEYLQDTYFTYTSKPLKWQKLPPVVEKSQPHPIRLPECEPFTANSGIKIPEFFNTIKPYDYFKYFMPEKIFQETTRLTNISASLEFYKAQMNKRRKWREASTEDIKKWFGLIFLFGIVRKYCVNEYWSTDPLLGLGCVNQIMCKDRFSDIRRYICFYDKRKKAEFEKIYPPLDPFYKFRFLIEHINEVCRKAYVPERELSVDESMISYQGIHRLKVFMPRKPIKWGFKVFVLAESSSGYVCNMILNEGHKRGENEDILSKRVVLEILQGYEHQGFRVYMDRWYTSADLLSELKKRGFGGCGTIFLSRVGLVNDLRKEVREFKDPGEASFYTNNDLTFVAWYQYRRQVYVLSNFHSSDWTRVEKARKISYFGRREYKIYDYDAPRMIRDYNIYMGGVDLFNQRVSYYIVDYDILKWYMRIVFWIFEIAMVNSYLLYCKVMKEKKLVAIASSEFRMEVIRNLTGWDFDPTKAVYRKGITNQMLEKEREMDEVDKEFHNLNIKRKSQGEIDKLKVFSGVEMKVKCSLEYIGVGICERCKKKRRKLRKTDFWCKACQKGICPSCFNSHKQENILKRLINDTEVYSLFNYIISRKKVKVEKTSKFYEMQVQKSRGKVDQKPKNNETSSKINETSTNAEIPRSETNYTRNTSKMTPVVVINDENASKESSDSEESVIMGIRRRVENRMRSNFDDYLNHPITKKKFTEDLKSEKGDFHQLKADLENFYSFRDNPEQRNESPLTKQNLEERNGEKSPRDVNSSRKERDLNENSQTKRNSRLEQNLLEELENDICTYSVPISKNVEPKQQPLIKKAELLITKTRNEEPTHTVEKTEVIGEKIKIVNKPEINAGKPKDPEIRLIGRHFPSQNPKGKQVNCIYCKRNNSRRTIGYCSICKVALCPLLCFEKYHTEENLK